MTGDDAFVEVLRGGTVESRHRLSAALVDGTGRLVAWTGQPELWTFFRSAAKPLQALPLVADGVADAFAFTDAELAVCCASHSAEPAHVETVAAILAKIACGEEDLECGPHPPFHEPSARALEAGGRVPTAIHNNCSGKHAGMLAWARHHGVETKGYRLLDHPVQLRIRREIAHWTDTAPDSLPVAIDGCGVVTFAQPLSSMAAAFARLMVEAEADPEGPAGRVVRAVTGEPYFVGGTGRLSTRIMEVAGGRMVAKYGAEAVMCLGARRGLLGLAVKVEDGARRAMGPAVVEFLAGCGLLAESEILDLADEHVGSVENTRGELVGEVRARLRVRGPFVEP